MQLERQVWLEILSGLQSRLNSDEFSLWFENLEFLKGENLKLEILVPNDFYAKQIENRYSKTIAEILREGEREDFKIFFIDKSNLEGEGGKLEEKKLSKSLSEKEIVKNESIKFKNIKSVKDYISESKIKKTHPNLKEKYTFENFIVGANNKLAFNAAKLIAKKPGKAYNPCLIYGGVGMGKTHLLQSIGNEAFSLYPSMKILYVTAETFLNEFIESIKTGETDKFKKKYRYIDMLLIDDIHDLQNKESTQEELFHTFNALYENEKQMVFTCDRPPSELINLTHRLKNRFSRGLNADLSKPPYETRLLIIEKKLESASLNLSKELKNFLAENITTNIRDIESVITKIKAQASLSGEGAININFIKKIKDEIVKGSMKSESREGEGAVKSYVKTIELVKKYVCEEFKVSKRELESKKRYSNLSNARNLAMYLARELTELSTSKIGEFFGRRTHSTVLNAIKKTEKRRGEEEVLNNLIKKISDKTNN